MTSPREPEFTVHGPGDEDMRLVNRTRVTTGSTMDTVTAQTTPLVIIDVESRSLASAEEIERRSLGFSRSTAEWLIGELTRVLAQ